MAMHGSTCSWNVTMLWQVTSTGNAAQLGIDFADYYEASPLRK